MTTTPILTKIETAIALLLDLIRSKKPLACAFSAGKDSTVAAILCIEAARRAKLEGLDQPTHYITSATTLTDNPRMHSHLIAIHAEIEAFCERENLPVEVKLVKPSLASSFVVTTIGRGTLPRFPENSAGRQCAVEWKVKPQQRLTAAVADAAAAEGYNEPVTIIGNRFSESTERATRMNARGESSTIPMRDTSGRLVLSVVADWTLQDIWDTLEMFLDPSMTPFPSYTDGTSIHRLFELYRDANEGACGINLGDGGNKSPCGQRTGCWNCTLVGSVDKSMESMLNDTSNAFMRGLNDFRNMLMATQYDMSRRELVGRTISEAGHLPVRPDVYNFAFRRQMLGYLLTLDVLEAERAEQLEADIITGKVADTPENRSMAEVQFETVSLEQLMAVELHWGLHHYAPHAFAATLLWYEIKVLGRRYKVPTLPTAQKVSIPEKRWFHVGQFNRECPTTGLRDFVAEQWNKYRHPDRPFTHRELENERMVWFEEADGFEVNAEKACSFVTCEFEAMMIEAGSYSALEGATFLLNEGIVKLPAGMAGRYQHIAKRGQYFARMMEKLNLTPAELDLYLMKHSISEEAHSEIIAAKTEEEPAQADLFKFAA